MIRIDENGEVIINGQKVSEMQTQNNSTSIKRTIVIKNGKVIQNDVENIENGVFLVSPVGHGVAHAPPGISPVGFDLNDFCAQIGKQTGRTGGGHIVGKFDDFDSG